MRREAAVHGLRAQRGSAPVAFAMTAAWVVLLALAVMQLALSFHVRTIVIDAAGEGARYAALKGNDLDAGASRAAELINAALTQDFAQGIDARLTTHPKDPGVELIEMHVEAPIPVIGLIGPKASMHCVGRALVEGGAYEP
ncbi:MAG: pilus assembly protein [Actinomycetaceae bacterium]|nr:pilus assembly protein [Actinomycetaceae bacterium]